MTGNWTNMHMDSIYTGTMAKPTSRRAVHTMVKKLVTGPQTCPEKSLKRLNIKKRCNSTYSLRLMDLNLCGQV
jgi:hypothetical protein